MDADAVEFYRHEVEHWTVGQLQDALHGLPDDMVLRVDVYNAPSTSAPDVWGNDQLVVIAGARNRSDDDGADLEEFVVRVDYPSEFYMSPPTAEAP